MTPNIIALTFLYCFLGQQKYENADNLYSSTSGS